MLSKEERAGIQALIESYRAVYHNGQDVQPYSPAASAHVAALEAQLQNDDAARAARREVRAHNQAARLENPEV